MESLVKESIKLRYRLMRLPKLPSRNEFDIEQVKKMVDTFINAGGRYFFTEYSQYRHGFSSFAVAGILKQSNRIHQYATANKSTR